MLLDIELLGDPHLGRTFRNNVPLHRRGEREAMIWRRFEREINSTEAATHVCLGDLFDAPLVSFDTIWRTATAYWVAPETTRFVVLQGNHDASRDLERISAFDLFAALVRDRVEVIREPTALKGTSWLDYVMVSTAHRTPTQSVMTAIDITPRSPFVACMSAPMQPHAVSPAKPWCADIQTIDFLSDHKGVLARLNY